MKKFIVFFMLSIFLICATYFDKSFSFDNYNISSVQIFTSNMQNTKVDASKIVNGAGEIYECSYKNMDNVLNALENVSGVTYIISGNISDFENLKQNLNVKFVEESKTSFTGFSTNFNTSVYAYGKKVNVQAYYSENKIYVGSPLLLGSY